MLTHRDVDHPRDPDGRFVDKPASKITAADRERLATAEVDAAAEQVVAVLRRTPAKFTDRAVQTGHVFDTVDVGETTFHRRCDGVYPQWPGAMRFQANRPLTDDDMTRMAQIVGYNYAATVAGESLDLPERDSPYSFILGADMTKSRRDDLGIALEQFEENLPGMLCDGSPIRKTNRAGAGTKGTRLVDGFAEPDLVVHLYYDDVFDG
jgi:hypothetical protein